MTRIYHKGKLVLDLLGFNLSYKCAQSLYICGDQFHISKIERDFENENCNVTINKTHFNEGVNNEKV